MKAWLLAAIVLAAAAPQDGARAFRAGDVAGARAAFAQELERLGARAPATLHYDHALACLHAGDLAAAHTSAEAAAALEPRAFRVRVPVLLGCVEALRADEAARLAAAPGAIPADWDLALARGRAALERFAEALDAADEDLPLARRNAERLARRLAEWKGAREAADPARAEAQPAPPPPRVEELLERLQDSERPTPAPAAAPPAAGVERDW